MLAEATQWLIDTILDMGYWGIYILMSIESSFVPFPSEVVLVPAGYLAAKGEMDLGIVIFVALLGSLTGALINYFGAMWIGRRFLLRYGRYFFIKPSAIQKMDTFFEKHGPISTFTGRLIPGIRQLISIPAGLARMDMRLFLLYTSLGAGIWGAILAFLGYLIGDNEELVRTYLSQITMVVLVVVGMMLLLYYYWQNKK
ncbi:MAG: DedA family protein [Sulfurimonadaceae bacterium]|nr:DedA family protein [Sulfurimonadaceae bacterium]